MANALYSIFVRDQHNGTTIVDFDTDTIKAQLHRSSAYTFSQNTHDFEDDLPAHVAEATLSNVSVALSGNNVIIDCDDFVFPSVPAGAACDIVIFYKDTGTPATSPLIAHVDNGGTLSVTPNGENINVTIDANGIIRFVL